MKDIKMSPPKVPRKPRFNKQTLIGVVSAGILLIGFLAVRGGAISFHGIPFAEQVRIEFPGPGATLVTLNGRPDKASYLLAASDLWADTGLSLRPGQTLSISASGRANLAVHRLIEAAILDVHPRHGWVGPDGNSAGTVVAESIDFQRDDLKIIPGLPHGILLAFLHAAGEVPPSKYNPRPSGSIVVVGASGSLKNDSAVPRNLWLVMNDAVLDASERSRLAYLGIEGREDSTIETTPKRTRPILISSAAREWTPLQHWLHVRNNNYWNLWYDDNVGFYQVHVTFDKAK
jgi:hypothetical protein